MKVLSLFDGISCGRVALERAGIKVSRYVASEIDKYAISVSMKNWKDIERKGAVQDLNFKQGEFDLLIGGSPCQGLSRANNDRLNLNDERSALFFEYARLKQQVKPKWFLLENVVCDKQTEEIISEAMGVKPILINSSLLSAQNRERLYWTNIPFEMPMDKDIILQDVLDDAFAHESLFVSDKYKYNEVKNETNNRSCKMEQIGFLETGRQGQRVYSKFGKSPTLQAVGGNIAGNAVCLVKTNGRIRKTSVFENERLQTLPFDYTRGVSNAQRYKMIGNGWTVDIIAHIFKGIKK